jgi:tetratricopeptide (TPR) repeat protein
MGQYADDARLEALTREIAQGGAGQMEKVEALLAEFPEDARLHFLRGSMLVGEGRHIEAHHALSRAVALAPDFAIARFQLGLFQLTSGEADHALDTWGRLDRLPDGHYLRKFVDGLRKLIRDDFAGAIEALREGVALNQENPPLSRDMQMLIDRCRTVIAGGGEEDAISETALILRQFSGREH